MHISVELQIEHTYMYVYSRINLMQAHSACYVSLSKQELTHINFITLHIIMYNVVYNVLSNCTYGLELHVLFFLGFSLRGKPCKTC